jgi:hypothetical protein
MRQPAFVPVKVQLLRAVVTRFESFVLSGEGRKEGRQREFLVIGGAKP